MNTAQNDFLSEPEVAKWLGVSLRMLQNQRYQKTMPLPYLVIGGRIVYSRQAVLDTFKNASNEEQPPAKNKLSAGLKTATEGTKRSVGRPRKQH